MAGDLTEPVPTQSAELERPAPPAAPALDRDARRRQEPYGVFVGRFRLAYALLAVLLGAAVGALIVLAGRVDGGDGGAAWSSWQPQGSGTEQAKAIAEYVQPRYRLANGGQLVAIIAGEPTVQGPGQMVPVNYFAIQRGSARDDIAVLRADDAIAYQLCGLGARCAIRQGRPTAERGRLLRREALELALYTFKYVDGVDSVVAYLPPRPGAATPSFALFFRKDDFEHLLERPLHQTLPPRDRLDPGDLTQAEGEFIDRLVDAHVFQYTFQQAPDGSAVLYLVRPPL